MNNIEGRGRGILDSLFELVGWDAVAVVILFWIAFATALVKDRLETLQKPRPPINEL